MTVSSGQDGGTLGPTQPFGTLSTLRKLRLKRKWDSWSSCKGWTEPRPGEGGKSAPQQNPGFWINIHGMSSAKQTQMFIFPAVNYNFNRQKLWSRALKSSDRCLVPGRSHGLNLLSLRAPKLIQDSLKPLPPLRLVLPTRHVSGSAA